jgi:hypothetical protein
MGCTAGREPKITNLELGNYSIIKPIRIELMGLIFYITPFNHEQQTSFFYPYPFNGFFILCTG